MCCEYHGGSVLIHFFSSASTAAFTLSCNASFFRAHRRMSFASMILLFLCLANASASSASVSACVMIYEVSAAMKFELADIPFSAHNWSTIFPVASHIAACNLVSSSAIYAILTMKCTTEYT